MEWLADPENLRILIEIIGGVLLYVLARIGMITIKGVEIANDENTKDKIRKQRVKIDIITNLVLHGLAKFSQWQVGNVSKKEK